MVAPTIRPTQEIPEKSPSLLFGLEALEFDRESGIYIREGEFTMGSTENDLDAKEDEKPIQPIKLDAF